MERKKKKILTHFNDLRLHFIRSLLFTLIISFITFISKKIIFNKIILGPSYPEFWTYKILYKINDFINISKIYLNEINFTIQSRYITGQINIHITSSIIIGFILSFPYIYWEIWNFIKPGINKKKNYKVIILINILFIIGILFGYYIITPLSINFLSNYKIDNSIINEFDITSYISIIFTLTIICGFLFQIPIIVYYLTKYQIISPKIMKKYKKESIIIILTISAIITPPDVMSQLLIGIPMIILYEISIIISKYIIKKN